MKKLLLILLLCGCSHAPDDDPMVYIGSNLLARIRREGGTNYLTFDPIYPLEMIPVSSRVTWVRKSILDEYMAQVDVTTSDGNWCVITDMNGNIVRRLPNFSFDSNGVMTFDPASVEALRRFNATNVGGAK